MKPRGMDSRIPNRERAFTVAIVSIENGGLTLEQLQEIEKRAKAQQELAVPKRGVIPPDPSRTFFRLVTDMPCRKGQP